MKTQLEKILSNMRLYKGGDTSDWRVYDCEEDGGCYELEQWSDAGEDVIIKLRGATLAELAADARKAWENFDADKHAAQIYLAKREGDENARRFYATAPNTIGELLADARNIKAMHKWVWRTLDKAAKSEVTP